MKWRTKHIFFLIVLVLSTESNAQSSYAKKFRELSAPEKKWIFWHPFCALKVRKRTNAALIVVQEIKKSSLLDQYENGGKLDAFRHIFTMAFLAQKINVRKLRKLGAAHEKGNRKDFEKGLLENGELPDSISCEMDLRNNEFGFSIGKELKRSSPDSLRQRVVSFVKEGKAWEILRDEKGNYLSCDNKIIADALKKSWGIPKCLIQKK
jgi:hypothetical protein